MKTIFSFLFPPRCTFCGDILKGSGDTCPTCLENLPRVPEVRCKKCSAPFKTPHSLPVCLDCRQDKYPFKKVYAPFLYEDKVQNGLKLFKFRRKRSSAAPLACYMFEWMEKEGLPEADLITYVPIDFLRFRERGYNQSKLLAAELSTHTGFPLEPLLKKKFGVRRQSSLSRKARKKNVRGAFSLLPEKDIKGKRILLIDDIYTTGATVGECSRILRRGGAKEVTVAVVALTHSAPYHGEKH